MRDGAALGDLTAAARIDRLVAGEPEPGRTEQEER